MTDIPDSKKTGPTDWDAVPALDPITSDFVAPWLRVGAGYAGTLSGSSPDNHVLTVDTYFDIEPLSIDMTMAGLHFPINFRPHLFGNFGVDGVQNKTVGVGLQVGWGIKDLAELYIEPRLNGNFGEGDPQASMTTAFGAQIMINKGRIPAWVQLYYLTSVVGAGEDPWHALGGGALVTF